MVIKLRWTRREELLVGVDRAESVKRAGEGLCDVCGSGRPAINHGCQRDPRRRRICRTRSQGMRCFRFTELDTFKVLEAGMKKVDVVNVNSGGIISSSARCMVTECSSIACGELLQCCKGNHCITTGPSIAGRCCNLRRAVGRLQA